MAAQPAPVPMATQYEQPNFATSVPSDLLTLPEAAAAIRVNIWTLKRWIRLGIIPTYRLVTGRDLRVSLATLVYPVPRKVTPKRNLVSTDDGVRVRVDPRPRRNRRETAVEQAETKI